MAVKRLLVSEGKRLTLFLQEMQMMQYVLMFLDFLWDLC